MEILDNPRSDDLDYKRRLISLREELNRVVDEFLDGNCEDYDEEKHDIHISINGRGAVIALNADSYQAIDDLLGLEIKNCGDREECSGNPSQRVPRGPITNLVKSLLGIEKEYEIWSEGYAATGERGGAVKHGVSKGKSFKGACRNYAQENDEFSRYFDPRRMTYWGCRLFDNETEARKSFG